MWEIALEYIRSLNFPNLPSRFQCMFGCETIEDIKIWEKFFSSTGSSKFNIVKIKTPHVFLGDANWFNQKGLQYFCQTSEFGNISFASYCYFANKYWSGLMTDNPQKEVLITLPCQVIEIL